MKIFFILLAFLFGFYICLNYSNKQVVEYFQNNNNNNNNNKRTCPNILIQKGNVLWLYNKNEKGRNSSSLALDKKVFLINIFHSAKLSDLEILEKKGMKQPMDMQQPTDM